jgi:hypothetical protein
MADATFGKTASTARSYFHERRYVKPFVVGRQPTAGWKPKGAGARDLREILSFASRRTETLFWKLDEGEIRFTTTNSDMFHGNVEALEVFGIGRADVIEQTDLPLHFRITSPDGTSRTIQLRWDGSGSDMMSLPPHVKRLHTAVRVLLVLSLCIGAWVMAWLAFKAISG